MTTLATRPAAGWALAVLALAGCATPAHRYAWQPPVTVGAEDRRACHARADRVAQQRYERYTDTIELVGPFGGPFGGMTLAQRAYEEREEFYEAEMRACLRERGYPL
jgi:hypothetical protein